MESRCWKIICYKGKIARTALYFAGVASILLSIYYFFQIIWGDLWFDTPFRTVQAIMFFGGVILIVLGKILKNQERIIRLLGSDKE
jgi:hypothetical protein